MADAETQSNRFDAIVDRAFEKLRGRSAFDRLFYFASFVGDHSGVWVVLALLRAWQDHSWHVAIRVLIAIPIESFVVNIVVKSMFRRNRPVHEGERPHHLRTPRTSSFPSGHATSAFMAATLLSWHSSLWPAYFAMALLVALSRVHVRIHHGTDVVAGAGFGLFLGVAARLIAFR